jgi:hypothetical protein
MKKNLLTFVSIVLLTVSAFAQERLNDEQKEMKSEIAQEIKEARNAVKSLKQDVTAAKQTAGTSTQSAVTVADVGEPDSFGKNVKFFGTAVTGAVYMHKGCDAASLSVDGIVLGVDDRCLDVTNTLVTSTATFNDIGRINLPAKSADNVIYFIANNLFNYSIFNSTATANFGRLTYSPSVTIESDALLDPAALNPDTGLPMNGSFTTGINGSKTFNRTYQTGASDFGLERYSTAATRGFARSYFADLGLSNHVINQIYKKPMTIKLNLRVSTRLVEDGVAFYTMRFMGN